MNSIALLSQPVSAHPVLRWLDRRRHEAAGAFGVGLAVLGGHALIAEPAGSVPRLPTAQERSAPAVAAQVEALNPFEVRDVAPDKAVAINAAMPIASGPNPAARPFAAPPVKSLAYARALECLAQAIYYEAALEPLDGQRAVAQVILNRVRHPAYPASVCAVVYQGHERATGCQFSFTCDGALARTPMRQYWLTAREVAHAALQGYAFAPAGNATHYHANYVVPYWASTLTKNLVVGNHIFYRWNGGWGRPAAFTQRYSRKEQDPWALRSEALAAEARDRSAPDDIADVVVEARLALPPELARLVEAEIGAKGESRVAMRIPSGKLGAGTTDANRSIAIGSPNLRWTLTGSDEKGIEQKPLGKPAPKASPKVEEAISAPASTPGPAPAATGEQ